MLNMYNQIREKVFVQLLGVRGSAPIPENPLFMRYGGATMAVLIRAGEETVLLDAGTGLFHADLYRHAPPAALTLLLSHAHVDHILGLTDCPWFYNARMPITCIGARRGGLSIREQLAALLSPPLWPVGPEAFRADVRYVDLPETAFQIGEITVEATEGHHPGGVSIFRLSYKDVSIVYATDCEFDQPTIARLAPFAQDCTLLLCDAQFSDGEYANKVHWGHSATAMAVAFSEAAGAKCTIFVHHAPGSTDDVLDARQAALAPVYPHCTFGRAGEIICL